VAEPFKCQMNFRLIMHFRSKTEIRKYQELIATRAVTTSGLTYAIAFMDL
jgi:hypothetical protein